jgi:arylsulfatase A-like enzyme
LDGVAFRVGQSLIVNTAAPNRDRVALLTGLQPHRVPSQVNRLAFREGFWTIAHALRAAGYETAAIGKMHFFPPHADHGFETMRLCEHPRVFKPTGSTWLKRMLSGAPTQRVERDVHPQPSWSDPGAGISE